jgi:hypothetical protein
MKRKERKKIYMVSKEKKKSRKKKQETRVNERVI